MVMAMAAISRLTSALPAAEGEQSDIDRWIKELSNWGRWGKDDQLDRVNLITPAKRKQAAGLVKGGVFRPWILIQFCITDTGV